MTDSQDTVWSRIKNKPDAPCLQNHTALIWAGAVAYDGKYATLREHGLSESELMHAHTQLPPSDDAHG